MLFEVACHLTKKKKYEPDLKSIGISIDEDSAVFLVLLTA